MKSTFKSKIYFILQIIFFLAIPLFLIWIQSGGLAKGYKISVTAIISTIIIIMVFKKAILNAWLKKVDNKITQIEVSQLSAIEPTVINSLKKQWVKLSFIQLIINMIVPICLLLLFILTIKVVEQGLMKLYACLLLSAISMCLGSLFKALEILSIKAEHE